MNKLILSEIRTFSFKKVHLKILLMLLIRSFNPFRCCYTVTDWMNGWVADWQKCLLVKWLHPLVVRWISGGLKPSRNRPCFMCTCFNFVSDRYPLPMRNLYCNLLILSSYALYRLTDSRPLHTPFLVRYSYSICAVDVCFYYVRFAHYI